MRNKLRKTENFHVFLWLLKDMCWMLEFKILAIFMIIPTLAVAFYVIFISKKDTELTLINIAITFWILANSVWMLSDFFNQIHKLYSLPFFIIGIIIMLVYFVKLISKNKT
jgi:hypothetical protein